MASSRTDPPRQRAGHTSPQTAPGRPRTPLRAPLASQTDAPESESAHTSVQSALDIGVQAPSRSCESSNKTGTQSPQIQRFARETPRPQVGPLTQDHSAILE